jgi:pimeloyl-ACP methyl ester carboxylesterase
VLKPYQSHFVTLGGRRIHYLEWGASDAPLIVMIHGWMDVAASFQFLVDAMQKRWRVVAPDLRGFGQTESSRENTNGYWFYDYLADLDRLIDHVSPHAPVNLLGHSLGGNIVNIYAGVRPERIRRLVALDGFGVPRGDATQAQKKIVAWLDATRAGARLAPYADLVAVIARLQKNNPRLTNERAHFVAQHWAELRADGQYHLRADPAHKLPFPTVYRLEEVFAIWNCVSAPTLWLGAEYSNVREWLGYGRDDPAEMGAETQHSAEFNDRLAQFKSIQFAVIADSGHMVHHDQPDRVAAYLEPFLATQ